MCRIAGIINNALPIETLQAYTKEMCDLQRHGGPDDGGIFTSAEEHVVLGNRRLAILDLSSLGHMPMTYGDYTITYNGEIYNFHTIRAKLQSIGFDFHTGTDTEVILAGFAAYGTHIFKLLCGMFGLAIWDATLKTLYLARGVSGIKPLYYAVSDGKLAFASEVRAFAPIPYLRTEDPDWKIYMMAYGNLPEPNTTLRDVKMLPKGSYLKFHVPTGQHTIESYYHHSLIEKFDNEAEVLKMVRDNLNTAVDRHLISDAPIGVFLSGGLDSSLITLLASKFSKSSLNTLSIYFNEGQYSEKKYQDIVLKRLSCEHHQFLLKEDDFHENLPSIFNAMDLPSSDGINTWFISKFAKESGLKAVLSGIGGDELFGGYPSFKRMQTVSMLEKLPARVLHAGRYSGSKKLRRLAYLSLKGAKGKYLFLRGQFIPSEIAMHLGMDEAQVWDRLEQQPQLPSISHLTLPNQASWMEYNMYMQNQLLRDSDVMSMAHGVEIRVPFLDKEFLRGAMQIASRIKYAGPRGKQLLINAFSDILPTEIYNRPKMGFAFPFREWMAKDEYVKEIMGKNKSTSLQYDKFISGNVHWSQLMTMLLIERYGTTSPAVIKSFKRKPEKQNGIGNTLFLTLKTFSATGGIEKVGRVAGKALYELGKDAAQLSIYSLHDLNNYKQHYFPNDIFSGFRAQKISFVLQAIKRGMTADTVILSHINLSMAGYLIKLFSPNTRLILLAHGIEVWKPLTGIRKRMIDKCDTIMPVSNYTKNIMKRMNGIEESRFHVMHNCLDPYLSIPIVSGKSPHLKVRYGFKDDDIILVTVTRLSQKERYKGYDKVLMALKDLKQEHPKLKYLLIGKYDDAEKRRVDDLIREYDLSSLVTFAGFVPDSELAEHFNVSDIYIMPSEKEGFGIVFIEAMYYGLPVIAGNIDGSVDALLNGKLGLLVNPLKTGEIKEAIVKVIHDRKRYVPDRKLLMEHFGYNKYKEALRKEIQVVKEEV